MLNTTAITCQTPYNRGGWTTVPVNITVTDTSGTSLLVENRGGIVDTSALVGISASPVSDFTFTYYVDEVIESIFPKTGWAAGGSDVSSSIYILASHLLHADG